jgi:hypothetical protein
MAKLGFEAPTQIAKWATARGLSQHEAPGHPRMFRVVAHNSRNGDDVSYSLGVLLVDEEVGVSP